MFIIVFIQYCYFWASKFFFWENKNMKVMILEKKLVWSPVLPEKGFGIHGKLLASGSDETSDLPSLQMTSPVWPSRMTKVGIPCTLNFLDNAFCHRDINQ